MLNLNDNKISYIIVSASIEGTDPLSNNKLNENLVSNLYTHDYSVISLSTYNNGLYDRAFLAMNATDNNELRFDAIKLIERYNQDFVIVKYKGETEPKKILKDGSEIPVGINVYDSNSENINYIYNGVSFTFNEIKQYFHPKERKDIKAGMIVEILHNKIWVEKTILNPDLEWENLYKLLSKYDKVRVSF